MVIDRYLTREIVKPLGAILGVLVVIFAGYASARYLADAASGLLSGSTVASLILLKVAIALEVLVPITFYLSVVLALGRLYTDFEMTALEATGVGSPRALSVVFRFSLFLAVLVASLSLYVRPWAYDMSYRLRKQAKVEVDLARFEAGRFYELQDGDRVIFAEDIDRGEQRAKRVFVQRDLDDKIQVVCAKEVRQATDQNDGGKILVFLDGYGYEFSRSGEKERVFRFERFLLPLTRKDVEPEYKRKAAPTIQLARSDEPEDIAELQWRLSTPFSTVLLGLLGFPMGRTAPRRGKYAKLVAAVLIFAVYYNLEIMAKHWVEERVVGSVPGMWWVLVLMAAFVAVLLWRADLGILSRNRR